MIMRTGHDQWTAITCENTYNARNILTSQCLNIENPRRSQEMISESPQLQLQSLLLERSAPIPVCVYTNTSSILAEAFYGQPRDTLLE
jgi:hypothetical protein